MKKRELMAEIEKLYFEMDILKDRLSELEKDPQPMSIPEIPEKFPWNPPKPFPPLPNNLICSHCGKDSGWPIILYMVIPPEGLRCKNCGEVCIYGNSVTCSTLPPTSKGYESHTHIPVTFDPKPTEPIATCKQQDGWWRIPA